MVLILALDASELFSALVLINGNTHTHTHIYNSAVKRPTLYIYGR